MNVLEAAGENMMSMMNKVGHTRKSSFDPSYLARAARASCLAYSHRCTGV